MSAFMFPPLECRGGRRGVSSPSLAPFDQLRSCHLGREHIPTVCQMFYPLTPALGEGIIVPIPQTKRLRLRDISNLPIVTQRVGSSTRNSPQIVSSFPLSNAGLSSAHCSCHIPCFRGVLALSTLRSLPVPFCFLVRCRSPQRRPFRAGPCLRFLTASSAPSTRRAARSLCCSTG